MATLQPSEFCRYDMTPQEEKRSKILSPENIFALQNRLAQAARDKIELAATRKDFDAYWQREAELQGEIRAYQALIDDHHAMIAELEQERISDDFESSSVVTPSTIFNSTN